MQGFDESDLIVCRVVIVFNFIRAFIDIINKKRAIILIGAEMNNIFWKPECLFRSFLLIFTDCIINIYSQKPNILWLSAEDLSPRLGVYGDAYATTPVLDSLGSAGTGYKTAFTVCGVCSPSRTAIITGMYPSTIRGHDHRSARSTPLPAYCKRFPEYLQDAGYYTTNNSKTDYNFSNHGIGWDATNGTAHWRNRPAGKPFFSVFNFGGTHESQHFDADNRTPTHNPGEAPLPPKYPDNQRVRNAVAWQYDNITRLDNWVKGKLQELSDAGLVDNTVVFFWGDHGSGLPLYKRWIWDSGIHVPLIVAWPGEIEPGTMNDELVSALDFAPTVLSLAGVEKPAYMQGRIFLGPGREPAPEYLFFTRDRMDAVIDRMRAVRSKKYKYIKNYLPELPYSQVVEYGEQSPIMQELRRLHAEGGLNEVQELWFQETKPVEELYDLENDPFEINNLAGSVEHSDMLERMRSVHQEWLEDTDDFLLNPEDQWVDAFENAPASDEPFISEPPTITKAALYPDGLVGVELTPPVEGASVSYAVGEGDTAKWVTYTGEFKVPEGARLWARTGWGAAEMLVTIVEATSVAVDKPVENLVTAGVFSIQSLVRRSDDGYYFMPARDAEPTGIKVVSMNGICVYQAEKGSDRVKSCFKAAPGLYFISFTYDNRSIRQPVYLY
jgi:arylsulfatase A-like enzyme